MSINLESFYLDFISNGDIEKILDIYNSNKEFLIRHLNRDKITRKWMIEELKDSKKNNFETYKIIDKTSQELIGIVNFKLGHILYLSLLIIGMKYRNKGKGTLFIKEFEEYFKDLNVEAIKIDIASNYNEKVYNFWIDMGFLYEKSVKLKWCGNIISAKAMKKSIL